MLHYLINFFYPPRCAACDVRLGSDAVRRLCAGCLAQIDRMPEAICEVCGNLLDSNRDQTDVANGPEWCANCRISPPHFTRARAVVRYRHDSSDAGDGARSEEHT